MSRSLTPAVLVFASLLGACAHQGTEHDGTLGNGSAITVPGGAIAPATMHEGRVLSWGQPIVVPAGLAGPQAVADTDGAYLLDTGDRLRIFVYGQPNLSRLYTVDHEGKVSIPLIGNTKARGKTTYELEAIIRNRLATQFVKDPQVTVDVQQNRPFFILGEVRTAGQYPYVNGMTIEQAVAIAGGYSERANEYRARITRRINGLVEVLEVPGDYVLLPGDSVYIPERFF
jgi:polysaccharide export outer membrane protein